MLRLAVLAALASMSLGQAMISEDAHNLALLQAEVRALKETSAKDRKAEAKELAALAKELAALKETSAKENNALREIMNTKFAFSEHRMAELEKRPIQATVQTPGTVAPPESRRRLSEPIDDDGSAAGITFTPENGFESGVTAPMIHTDASGNLLFTAGTTQLSLTHTASNATAGIALTPQGGLKPNVTTPRIFADSSGEIYFQSKVETSVGWLVGQVELLVANAACDGSKDCPCLVSKDCLFGTSDLWQDYKSNELLGRIEVKAQYRISFEIKLTGAFGSEYYNLINIGSRFPALYTWSNGAGICCSLGDGNADPADQDFVYKVGTTYHFELSRERNTDDPNGQYTAKVLVNGELLTINTNAAANLQHTGANKEVYMHKDEALGQAQYRRLRIHYYDLSVHHYQPPTGVVV